MRPVRAWSLPFVLVVAACSTPPLVGEYEGPATTKDVLPAELELRDDGSCLWHPAVQGATSYFIPLGRWSFDSARRDVVVVHPDRRHPERSLRFDVTTGSGDTVL